MGLQSSVALALPLSQECVIIGFWIHTIWVQMQIRDVALTNWATTGKLHIPVVRFSYL